MSRIVAAEYLTLDGVGEDRGRVAALERLGWLIPSYGQVCAGHLPHRVASQS